MEIEKLDNNIYLYKNIMNPPIDILTELDIIFKTYDKDFRSASINDKEYNLDLRSCTVYSLFQDISEIDMKEYQKAQSVLNYKINNLVYPAILDFVKKTGLKLKEREPWEILKYTETQKLTWHCDNGPSHPCTVSFVIYFNDDYEGGEVEFRDKVGGRLIKPPANSILIFPSNMEYVHRVVPVTSGTKYAAISFGE
jgi:Rps23 Pro-64 3,4-dihydroxylase Tpa1-like proline 4-hydroxylase